MSEVGPQEPFSYEKLCPVLALYRAPQFHKGVEIAAQLVNFWRHGAYLVLYTDPRNQDDIAYFKYRLQTARVLINTPSSQGAIGDLYNFKFRSITDIWVVVPGAGMSRRKMLAPITC